MEINVYNELYDKIKDNYSSYLKSDLITFPVFANIVEKLFNRYNLRNNSKKAILVTQLNALGDAFLTTGFLRELKQCYSNYEIILVCSKENYSIFDSCPYCSKIYSVKFKNKNMKELLSEIITFSYENLWQYKFEMSFSTHWGDLLLPALFINWFSGANQRIGYGEHTKSMYFKNDILYKSTFGQGFNFDNYLLTDNVKNPYNMYLDLDRKFYLLEHLGFKIINKSPEVFNSTFYSLPKGKKVAMMLGASSPKKKYPAFKLVKALKEINTIEPIIYILLGDKNDIKAGKWLENKLDNVINLVNQISINELYSVISQSDIYLGHDTFCVHVAAAYSKPCIVIEAEAKSKENDIPGYLSYYHRFKPYNTQSIILRPDVALSPCSSIYTCGGCGENKSHCIEQIRPEKIVEAYKELI